MSLISVLPRRL